ncbi:MAG: cytotoxin [Dethiobacter sp.]|nr:cytotoxin [Dethiobacter sp.]
MPKYKLKPTSKFKRLLKKLPPELKQPVRKALELLQENPSHPSLRTKKYKSIVGVWESSIDMNNRLLWEYDESEKTIIILLAVGGHDIL